jgi:hypothetical protein
VVLGKEETRAASWRGVGSSLSVGPTRMEPSPLHLYPLPRREENHRPCARVGWMARSSRHALFLEY